MPNALLPRRPTPSLEKGSQGASDNGLTMGEGACDQKKRPRGAWVPILTLPGVKGGTDQTCVWMTLLPRLLV